MLTRASVCTGRSRSDACSWRNFLHSLTSHNNDVCIWFCFLKILFKVLALHFQVSSFAVLACVLSTWKSIQVDVLKAWARKVIDSRMPRMSMKRKVFLINTWLCGYTSLPMVLGLSVVAEHWLWSNALESQLVTSTLQFAFFTIYVRKMWRVSHSFVVICNCCPGFLP